MRLTWKRQPNETGLARVCQGERGYDLRLDGKCIAHVRLNRTPSREQNGYFWSCPATDRWPWHNTAAAGHFFDTIEAAKADCKAWFVAILKQPPPSESNPQGQSKQAAQTEEE